ncbi:MAG: transcription-repair coupling factor [Erysipelotrichaceae bacterium]|nr:transcription-repair coupling factor [Erysipelotrichaceae bacterium]
MDELLKKIYSLPVTSPLLDKKGSFVIEENLAAGLLFASIFAKNPKNYALVSSNQYSAQRLYEFLLNFLPEEQVVFFPSDELLRAEALASSRELLSQRLYALGQLRDGKPKILVTHPSALLRFLPSPQRFSEEILRFKVGDSFDLRELKSRLSEIGYQASDKIERSLQFASRGDILDVYSVSYLNPIRIEFFGDEVESIRLFDVQTQESVEQLGECVILPATDIFLNDDELTDFMLRAKSQMDEDEQRLGPEVGALMRQNVGEDLERFVARDYRSELYRYFGFAIKERYSVLHYMDPEIVYIANKESFNQAVKMLDEEAHDFLGEIFYKGRTLSSLRQYMDFDDAIPVRKNLVVAKSFSDKAEDIMFQAHKISVVGKSAAHILPLIQTYCSTCDKVVLSVPDIRHQELIKNILVDNSIEFETTKGFGLPKGKVSITESTLNEGFEIPALKIAFISSSELFGKRSVSSRFTSRFKNATILHSYEDLKPGDYVVHEYNGIGQFLDVKTIEIDGIHRDFLHIAYAGNEFLYVPLEQFRLVRKYAGREGAAPKLSHLSGKEWEKRKECIKKRVNELADRLLNLYRERAHLRGFSFPPDDELQASFESEFAHALTPDQQKAVEEIKKDMESEDIMDRLLCGDVGFGKTEVAFRAAFKAICAGKQVAILCPTTLLARQHFEVAEQRFSPYGVKMALFSRLVPESEQKKSLELIKEGKIDLIIGTHRLLSKDFEYKDLGLLIIDEEQRFGVEQKEKIKEIKSSVDVLTLSATPIPRTLQMSLLGIRPISEIMTAPSQRMPIQTYVTPYNEEVVNELIQRELSRRGQVFYVHNRVETIYRVASRLAAHLPLASVGVVHGQMDHESIEDVMEKFYDGDINVLVCTSIVENGIDIPNANMIIVENADRFGLSQLYQIKGRVGRGDRIAFAYLLYKQEKDMNADAQKRLQAIQEFTELGSGYKIAQRDLMIRGAGDILGPEQAGFIDSIGLDLYLKMLNEAIKEKATGEETVPPAPKKLFAIDAYIPKEYASNSDKVELYHELEDIKTEKELDSFKRKMKDIYGRLPEEVELVIQKKRIDILGDLEEFSSIEEIQGRIEVTLSNAFTSVEGIGTDLFNALVPYLGVLRVTYVDKRLKFLLAKRDKWLETLEKIMRIAHQTYLKKKAK